MLLVAAGEVTQGQGEGECFFLSPIYIQCTMGQTLEIDILEVCKRKNYYMLIFIENFSLFFVNGASLPKDLPCLKINFFCAYLVVFH